MRRSSLDAVIPVLRQLILAELLVRSRNHPVYRSELARRLGVSPSSLQRPLRDLTTTGILKATKHGREMLYEPEHMNPLIPELTGLLRKTRGLLDVLRDALAPLGNRVLFAFVHGSMASGTERPESDVDLFTVGDATLGEVSDHLEEPQRVLGREVNAIAYSISDMRSKASGKSHFVQSVLDKPRLFIVGTENDLARALETGASGASSDEPTRTRRTKSRRTP